MTGCLFVTEVCPKKCRDDGESTRPHRVNWSLLVSTGRLAEPWIQTNHGRYTKVTAVCSLKYVEEECTGHPGCLAPSAGRMNWVISYDPHWIMWPSSRPNALWFKTSRQKFGIESSKFNLSFGLGNGVVSNHRGNRWITDVVEMGNGAVAIWWTLHVAFFPLFSTTAFALHAKPHGNGSINTQNSANACNTTALMIHTTHRQG